MEKTLELHFLTQDGKTARLSVNDPKDGLTPAEVEAVMEQIIQSGVFQTNSGALVAVKEARHVTRDVQVVELTVEG